MHRVVKPMTRPGMVGARDVNFEQNVSKSSTSLDGHLCNFAIPNTLMHDHFWQISIQ